MIKSENTNKILTSQRGAGTIILGLILIPLICFCVAFAIDLNMYLGVKAYLNNAMDAIATSALNKSALDSYRADKVLRLKDDSFFIQNVENEVRANLVGPSGSISKSGNKLSFNSSLDFLPYPITLDTTFSGIATSDYNDGDNVTAAHTTDKDVTLTLNTQVDLPFLGAVLEIFGIKHLVPVNMSVSNTVRGIRVKESDDFTTKSWE